MTDFQKKFIKKQTKIHWQTGVFLGAMTLGILIVLLGCGEKNTSEYQEVSTVGQTTESHTEAVSPVPHQEAQMSSSSHEPTESSIKNASSPSGDATSPTADETLESQTSPVPSESISENPSPAPSKKKSGTTASSNTLHTNHISEPVSGTAATCTEDGLTDGTRCKICHTLLQEQTVIPATGHEYTSKITTPATSLTAGVMTYTCSKCGHQYTAETPPTTDPNLKVIQAGIRDANNEIAERGYDSCIFTNLLQAQVKDSLVYHINKKEYLILYHDQSYIYNGRKLTPTTALPYPIFDSVADALTKGSIGTTILTRGYYTPGDGGNGIYSVGTATPQKEEYTVSDGTFVLTHHTLDSTINLLQMGYQTGESLDSYINNFTQKLTYKTMFIPSGTYSVQNCLSFTTSSKSYYGYETTLSVNDRASPVDSNYSYLFHVSQNPQNIQINGFDIQSNSLLGLMLVEDAENVTLSHCSFYSSPEGDGNSSMISLLGNWKNIQVKNCTLESHSTPGGIWLATPQGTECENVVFQNNTIYSSHPAEIITICSQGSMDNVLFQNNTIQAQGNRETGISIGGQGQAQNLQFVDNQMQISFSRCLLQYGNTQNLTFQNNTVTVNTAPQGQSATLFSLSQDAQEGENILVTDNRFTISEGVNLDTLVQVGQEFQFTNNTLHSDGFISRLFDAPCTFSHNQIDVKSIGAVYHNVKTVKNNQISVDTITETVLDCTDLNLTSTITIQQDTISAAQLNGDLMAFRGSAIFFHGHGIKFQDFTLNVAKMGSSEYYLANGTAPIQDSVVVQFLNSNLSLFQDSVHRYVANDGAHKVDVRFLYQLGYIHGT